MHISKLFIISLVSVATATSSELTISKSKCKSCSIFGRHEGDTLIQCPGCQTIIDKDGHHKLQQGKTKPCDTCYSSRKQYPKVQAGCHLVASHNPDVILQCPGRQTIFHKNGEITLQCPGCQKFYDKNRNVNTEHGATCADCNLKPGERMAYGDDGDEEDKDGDEEEEEEKDEEREEKNPLFVVQD
jgi:uncharacterized C2H2 Zn-finger protein